jgi:subtilisin family serine protease
MSSIEGRWERLIRRISLILLVVSVSRSPQDLLAQTLELRSSDAALPRPTKHPKISGSLRYAEQAIHHSWPLQEGSRPDVNASGIQVYLTLADYAETHLNRLRSIGVQVELTEPSLALIQARVPVGLLDAVAQLPFVRYIRAPHKPYADAGSTLTQADGVLRSDLVRSTLGVVGSGVRIGVIQTGFNGIAASQASGDLPLGITTFTARASGNFAGSGAEGTAMLELIHDIAPGAQLFAASFTTSLEEIAAVNWLADVAGGPNPRRGTPGGVDIIVDDISWFNLGPYDGSSALSRALTAAVDRGVAYFKSAGNRADQHWRGFYSACPGSTFQNFNAPNCGSGFDEILNVRVPGGGDFCAFLQWNDPWGASGNDYDLRLWDRDADRFLTSSDGVDGGTDEQSGTQNPEEGMCFTDSGGSTRNLGVVIENFQGLAAPRQLELFLTSDVVQLEYLVKEFSVPNAGDAKKVFSVGAVDWRTPDTIESYSSRGPTLDGRLKPEVVAPDCVSVTGNGGFPTTFCGTSAAAPHAGAVAALVLSANPSLSPSQLYAVIVAPTFDLGTPFPNTTFGFGRIDAFASTQLAKNQPTLGLSVQKSGSGQLDWVVSFNYPNPSFGAPTLFADVYFGYLRPDGALTFLGPGLGSAVGDLNNPQSFTPLLSSLEADPGASLSPTQVFSTLISGPPGEYVAFFGAMPTGAGPSGNLWSLGSHASNGGSNLQGVAVAPFSFP